MSDKLLCEREVLVRMGWPSRHFLNARMRTDRFSQPCRSYRGIGDQWSDDQITNWLHGKPSAAMTGEQKLLARFSA